MLEGFDAILRVKVPEQVYDTFRKHAKAGSEKQAAWNKMWKARGERRCVRLISSIGLLNRRLNFG